MGLSEKLINFVSGGAVEKVVDKALSYLPDTMSEKEKSIFQSNITKATREFELDLSRIAIEEEKEFNRKIIAYEGKAKEVPKWIVCIRSLIRPVITIAVDAAFIYMILYPSKFSPQSTEQIRGLVYIVNSFWFGSKTLEKYLDKK